MPIWTGLFLLTLIVSGTTRAESSFLSCQNPNTLPQSSDYSLLHSKIAEKKLVYLQKNASVTAQIISCLERIENWQAKFPEGCEKFKFVLTNEILEKNFAFRMSEALSVKAMLPDENRTKDIFDFESQTDVSLKNAPGFGVLKYQSPLIPAEVRYVRAAFTAFWKNFASRYLTFFDKRLAEENPDKYERRHLENLNGQIRAALNLTSEDEMLKALSFIDDPGFKAMAQTEYSEFRHNHYRAWMSHLESMRVIAFIGKPEPSVAEMRESFQVFQAYGLKNVELLKQSATLIRAGLDLPTDDLLSDVMITEEVLKENPGLCLVADKTLTKQIGRAWLKTLFVDVPITIGLLATAMLAPPIVSLPLMVAADVYWISTTQLEVRKSKDLFFATLSKRNERASADEVYEAEGQAILSIGLAPLTLTAFHPNILKNLSRAARNAARSEQLIRP